MTEERARYYAEKFGFNLGITFYVVRSRADAGAVRELRNPCDRAAATEHRSF